MAILFMEGFDGYASVSEALNDHRIGVDSVSTSYSLQTGRDGSGQCFEVDEDRVALIAYLPQATTNTVFIQFAFKVDVLPGAGTVGVAAFWDTSGVEQGNLTLQATTGDLVYKRGTDSSGTIIGTSSASIGAGSWHYVECKVKFDNTAGEVVIKVDGVEHLNTTGQDTLNGGTASISSVLLGETSSGSDTNVDCKFDDLIIGDTSDSSGSPTIGLANDLLGDCTIEYLYPDGAGNYTQFTPSAGVNYQNVDEGATQDGDTTYNSSSTAGHKDTFTCDNLSISSGTIHAVQVTNVSKKESGGGRLIRGMVRSGGVDASGTGRYVPDSYAHRNDIFEVDPSSAAWTVSAVNSIEVGYELET